MFQCTTPGIHPVESVSINVNLPFWRTMFNQSGVDGAAVADPTTDTNWWDEANGIVGSDIDFSVIGKPLNNGYGRMILADAYSGNFELWVGFDTAAQTAALQVWGFDWIDDQTYQAARKAAATNVDHLTVFPPQDNADSNMRVQGFYLGLACRLQPPGVSMLDTTFPVSAGADTQTFKVVAGARNSNNRVPLPNASVGATTYYMAPRIVFPSSPFRAFLVRVVTLSAGGIIGLGRVW